MTDRDDRNAKFWRAAGDAYQRHGSGCLSTLAVLLAALAGAILLIVALATIALVTILVMVAIAG